MEPDDDDEDDNVSPLMHFSSTCYYFAESLTDMMRESDSIVPIGLISTAIGGSMIEAWNLNSTTDKCVDTATDEDGWVAAHEELYHSNLEPFLSTTIKGVIWYQGENNVGSTPGNSEKKVGYGCQMKEMIKQWRTAFSQTPHTTDPEFPFGIVTVASGGSEGNDFNIGTFRSSQAANYGSLPNDDLPNTFVAQAYDLNDPYRTQPATSGGAAAAIITRRAVKLERTIIMTLLFVRTTARTTRVPNSSWVQSTPASKNPSAKD